MKDFKSKIIENKKISEDFFRLSFSIPNNISIKAGQFLSLKIIGYSETFLRRPFAFSSVCDNSAEIIYQVRGKTTQFLSSMKSGQELLILAPLGNGFSDFIDKDFCKNKIPILVAGGVGLGPMLCFHKEIEKSFEKAFIKNSNFISGFRTDSLIPELSIFPENSSICCDDGSFGFKGNVLDFLKKIEIDSNNIVFCCGPYNMMKFIAKFCIEKNIECFVSLEEMMACSLGVCMGCVVDTKNGKRRVCKDGPIFNAKEIVWH